MRFGLSWVGLTCGSKFVLCMHYAYSAQIKKMGGAWAWFRLSVVVGVALTISSVRAFVCYATQGSPCLCESDDISERVDLTYYDDYRWIMSR